MELINQIKCHNNAKNTGFCDCVLELRNIVDSFRIPKGKVFTETELQSTNIIATLKAMTVDVPKKRLYPVAHFTDFKDNSEKPVYATFGYGTGEYVRDGQVKWEFEFRQGGLTLSNALRSFNGSQNSYDYLFIDSNNQLIGTIGKDSSGNNVMGGIPCTNVYTMPFGINDGKKPSTYMIAFEFDPVYINENVAVKQYSKTDFLLKDVIVGLQNVNLKAGTLTTSSAIITLATDCGDDLSETYSTEFAAASLWGAKNTTTGAAITITSVAYNVASNGWLVTLDTADTDMPSVGGKISISLAAASVLDAAGVSPYEGVNVVTYTRP